MDGIRLNLPQPDVMRTLATPSAGGDSLPAARQFEAMLASMLVKEMRSSLSEGFFGKGAGGDVYGGWLDEHIGATLAGRDALHLEGTLRESLDRKARQADQQGADAPSSTPSSASSSTALERDRDASRGGSA
jgi:Rod binding domain-containing protein